MEVHELSFYKEFSCLMGQCPSTCCKGWQINVDEDTYKKYLLEKGKDGRRLRAGIEKKDNLITIKKHKGTCPFFTKEGRCSVQLAKGEDFLPEVCRVFPRFRNNYIYFSEELLFLSCPETARLFLKHIDDFYLNVIEKEINYNPWVTNDDEDYLNELVKIRNEILSFINNENYSRGQINYILKEYGRALQISLVEFSERPRLNDYLDSDKEFYIDAGLADKLITGGLYHIRLKKVAPFLFNLFKLYFNNFDKLTADEAQLHAKRLIKKMKSNCPKVENILRAYYKYYYLSEFLIVFEDYSILKSVYMGIILNHFLQLFFALYYDKYGHLTEEDMVMIITNFERRAEHNEEVAYALYGVIEEEIIKVQINEEM